MGLLAVVELGGELAITAINNLEKVTIASGGSVALSIFRSAEALIKPDMDRLMFGWEFELFALGLECP